jgi:excisionase family DNA binding protein
MGRSKFLDIDELAEWLRVKPCTIYKWVHEGRIPYVKMIRLVRFKEEDILKWLEEKHHKKLRINIDLR